jgi:hypothetical protein
MTRFGEFLSRLGNLHDCTVALIEWRPDQKAIGLEIEDLYFNFEGFPEYQGPLAGRIAFEGVKNLVMDFRGIQGPLRVHDFSAEEQGEARLAVAVTFWPTGKIEVNCGQVVFPDIFLPPAEEGT